MLLKYLLCLVVPGLASASPASQSFVGRAITGTKYIFSFGDSYSQTGFDPTLAPPSSSNPLGNPTFPGWTTSGGPNWLGYLVQTYNTSLTLDINLSYGGATVNASLVAPYTSTVLSLIDQVKQFTTYYASKPPSVPWTSMNTLFAVWLGVNDVGNSWWLTGEDTTIGLILDDFFEQCQIMYDAGGRYFLFLTVPPIQKSPLVLADTVANQNAEGAVIATFNDVLATKAAAFKSKNSGVTSWIVDTQAPFNTAIANPTAYGAADATCFNSDGVSCLWFNNYHPAMAIHRLVAQAVASALSGTFFGGGPPTSTTISTSTSKLTASTTTVVNSTTKAGTTITSKASATTASSTAPATTGAAHWGQCGGQSWTGPTTCVSPYTCTFSNLFYSQCL